MTDNLALGQFGTAELQSYIAMSNKEIWQKMERTKKVTRIQSYRVTGPSFFGEKKQNYKEVKKRSYKAAERGFYAYK